MVINKKTLVKFLNLTAIQGDIENKECLIKINDNIEVLSISEGKHFALKGTLQGKFDDNLGLIGIDSIKDFIGFINNFDDNEDINVTKNDNKLILQGNKLKISCILKSPEYIVNKLPEEKFKELYDKSKDNDFVLSKDIIKKIISYANSMKSNDLLLSAKGKELTLSLNDDKENSILASFEINETIKPFSIKVSKILIDILKTISIGDLIVSVKENAPIMLKIVEEGEKYKLTFIYMLALLKK